MRSRVFIGLVLGAAGGFLGYLLQEGLVTHNVDVATPLPDLMRQGTLVGMMLGLALGAIEGVAVNTPRLILWGSLLGVLVGAVGGLFGIVFGGQVFNVALLGRDWKALVQGGSILDFTHLVVARALGWTFLGAFPGMAVGAASAANLTPSSSRWLAPVTVAGFVGLAGWLLFWNRLALALLIFVAVFLFIVVARASTRRIVHGLIGGLIGGFLGGVIFDLVATVLTHPIQQATATASGPVDEGGPSRAIGITAIGALTGLFIGLVAEVMKQAWVRVLAGRNEGRDFIITRALTVMGRDERADVPLFGDPALAPQHAAIRVDRGRHLLLDGGAPPACVVNGQPVHQPLLLKDGDMIQLGQVRLLFREKATASRFKRPAADVQKPPPQALGAVSVPATHCPFCGAARDASGNCLCTVPGAPPGAATGPAPPGAFQAHGAAGPMPGGSGAPSAAPAPTWANGPGISAALAGTGSRLVAIDGPYTGQAFLLVGPSVTIGRDAGHTVALTADKTVSRRHAHVSDEGGRHVLYDDGSSNGTFVNSVRVSVQPLVPGDVVQFGASKFRYE